MINSGLDFSGAMNVMEGRQDWKNCVDFVSLRSIVGHLTSFVTLTPSFPHRCQYLLLSVSVLACSDESATVEYVAEFRRCECFCRSARWPASSGTVALRIALLWCSQEAHFRQVPISVLNVFTAVCPCFAKYFQKSTP